jgi:hypothetical protein
MSTSEEIKQDLKYWSDKQEHFKKTGNKKGLNVCKLMLDRYLDSFLQLPQCLQ